MKHGDALKYFAINNLTIEAAIRKVEEIEDFDLGHRGRRQKKIDQSYYPQFAQKLRTEAAEMQTHYAVFYCLENTIREIISSKLAEERPSDWWIALVPETVRKNAEGNQTKEVSSGITPRSSQAIDFTNFGELAEIIKANWTIFGELFTDVRAIERILANLNMLRAPIAHCKPLAEDEVVRLHLSLRDFFRQMS